MDTAVVLSFLIALTVFVATTLQMLVALVDVRQAHKEALEVARTEDQLVKEQPRLRRRPIRKELRTWRDADTERSLAYVDVVLLSWTLLVCASGAATASSLEGVL